ncbi:MAG: 5-(carboxyamino)imidazole ribonucleotide mutase [Planctomycetota bacterium]
MTNKRTDPTKPLVGVIMGSKSDWETMEQAVNTLELLGVPCESRVISAHRAPDLLLEYCTTAESRGLMVIVAGAGLAAHLAGVAAAMTHLPVLGVPMATKDLGGMDSLLSMVQMPGGVPVGTLAIGKAGATNAGLLAGAIIALSNEDVREKLIAYRAEQNRKVRETTL